MTDWHIVNILLPLLLPIVLVAIQCCTGFFRSDWRTNVLMPVRDGQLSWAGLGYCLNALYELRHSRTAILASPIGDWLYWLLNLMFVLLAVTAAVSPMTARRHNRRNSRGASIVVVRYMPMLLSFLLCSIAGVWLAVVHQYA